MKRKKQKRTVGIYLWKIILYIIVFFAIVVSVECFFLVEKTVENLISGTSEEHNSSMETDMNEEYIQTTESSDITEIDETIETSEASTPTESGELNNETNEPAEDDTGSISGVSGDNSSTGTVQPEIPDNSYNASQPVVPEDTKENGLNKSEENTNTTIETSTNTTEEDKNKNQTSDVTNTITNTVTNTIGNTVTNSVNTNIVAKDIVIDDEKEDKEDILKETLVCKKIHEHLKICYLEKYTEEERESVFLVIQMIDELPEVEEVLEKLDFLEEAKDYSGYSDYYSKLTEQVKNTYSYYIALDEKEIDLRTYVTNAEKLLNMYNLCGIEMISDVTEVIAQYYVKTAQVIRGPEIADIGDNNYTEYRDTDGKKLLPIIDTSQKLNNEAAKKKGLSEVTSAVLPQNGKGRGNTPVIAPIQSIKIDDDGSVMYKPGNLTEVYNSKIHQIDGHTTLEKLNRFGVEDEGYYDLDEIWVLKDGKNPDSLEESDWIIYRKVDIESQGMYFTSNLLDPNSNAIKLKNNATVRFVCTSGVGSAEGPCVFYDYDITDGYIYGSANDAKSQTNRIPTSEQSNNPNTTYWTHTNQSGINSPENYDNYTKNNKVDGTIAKLAFGNGNAGTNLGDEKWKDSKSWFNALNRANAKGVLGISAGSYMIGTYGLVRGLDSDGKIIYSPGVNAPLLFDSDETNVAGKIQYNDFYLQFERTGDTYVLDSIKKKGNNTDEKILSNLNKLHHTQPSHLHIYTNDFWPMDHVDSFGGDGHDLKFGNPAKKELRKYDTQAAFPESDDGKNDHNAYFGMQFSLHFSFPKDYIGPLEYYFFGDDDLWVFLDGELVCDLGGIHTAVGEYTNLWDYIDTSLESHELKIYYMERGASGSTCWMHFNLPHPLIQSAPDSKRGNLVVSKKVINTDNKQRYRFRFNLTDEFGNPINEKFQYIVNNRTGYVANDETFYLYDGENITIYGIPEKAKYTITEFETLVENEADQTQLENLIPLEHFAISSSGATGEIVAKQNVYAKFINAYNHTFAKVEKIWDDDNNSENTRPESIKVKLTAKTKDGIDCTDYVKEQEPEVQFEVDLSETNNWKYEWQDLPKYKLQTNGTTIIEATASDEIVYTIDEEQTDQLNENYYVLSKVKKDNTTIITNAIYKNIEIIKINSHDKDLKLGDAEFKLEKLKGVDGKEVVDESFEPLTGITSSDEEDLGKLTFSKLKYGVYRLTEIQAPDGYSLNKKSIDIIINSTSDLIIQETIENKKSIILPFTGGEGANVYAISGVLMVLYVYSDIRRQRAALNRKLKPKRRKVKRRPIR